MQFVIVFVFAPEGRALQESSDLFQPIQNGCTQLCSHSRFALSDSVSSLRSMAVVYQAMKVFLNNATLTHNVTVKTSSAVLRTAIITLLVATDAYMYMYM